MTPKEFEVERRRKRAAIDSARSAMFNCPCKETKKNLQRRLDELHELEKTARTEAEQSTGDERQQWENLGVLTPEQDSVR